MMMKFNYLLTATLIITLVSCTSEAPIEESESDVRSLAELQLELVNTRFQAYFHYNMCTFKNLNSEERHGRSRGAEPASMFAPTGLVVEQWTEVCKIARMEGSWLTTKHHGGFCLWDSEFTDYDVASSGDTTDIVGAFTTAFREAGLKVGLYYSILDYHHGINNGITSGNDVQFMKNQITELMTNYGKIDYMNFDGRKRIKPGGGSIWVTHILSMKSRSTTGLRPILIS